MAALVFKNILFAGVALAGRSYVITYQKKHVSDHHSILCIIHVTTFILAFSSSFFLVVLALGVGYGLVGGI